MLTKKNSKLNPLISIIVPVYNAEKYIESCINSLVHQTYHNLDIILVDDGSKDNSLEVCLKYAEKDKRIRVFTQENSGPSIARNKGIELAQGEYIGFVDSDDTVEKNMYEVLVNDLLSSDTALAIVGMKYIYKGTEINELFAEKERGIISKKEIMNVFFENPLLCFSSLNKLYSRELIGDIRFDTSIKMSEDQKFIYEILKKVEKVFYEPLGLYVVTQSEGSLTRSVYTKYHLALLDVNEYIINDTNEVATKENATLYNAIICLNLFVPNYKNGQFTKEDIERVNKIIKNNRRLVLKRASNKMKLKMLLYTISPDLLAYIINKSK